MPNYALPQLGNHRSAFCILVHDMNDSTSAEAYCTLGGEVVPAKTAQQIGQRSGLQPSAPLVTPLAAPGKQPEPGAAPMKRQKNRGRRREEGSGDDPGVHELRVCALFRIALQRCCWAD